MKRSVEQGMYHVFFDQLVPGQKERHEIRLLSCFIFWFSSQLSIHIGEWKWNQFWGLWALLALLNTLVSCLKFSAHHLRPEETHCCCYEMSHHRLAWIRHVDNSTWKSFIIRHYHESSKSSTTSSNKKFKKGHPFCSLSFFVFFSFYFPQSVIIERKSPLKGFKVVFPVEVWLHILAPIQ